MTDVVDLGRLPVQPAPRHSAGWWGALVAILSEATLFAALLAAYFYLRLRAPEWPIGQVEQPKLLLPSIGLVVLVASSLVAWRASRAMDADAPRRATMLLGATILLGIVFLMLQTIDFTDKDFGVDTNATGTMYYTVVGLHTAHVVAGVLLLGFAAWRVVRHAHQPVTARTVEVVTLYWHFVDAVWVAVFLSLIASEHWW